MPFGSEWYVACLRVAVAMESSESTSVPVALVEHLPSLMRRARILCRSQSDAEDLVSDTVTRAITYAHRFEQGTNLRAWLHRVQYHCFVSNHRRNKRERAALTRLSYELQTEEPVVQQAGRELSKRVVFAIAELPTPMKAVVELVDLCELSYREAAEQLNVPVGTVMSRLFRGRNRLATHLSGPAAAPVDACAARAA